MIEVTLSNSILGTSKMSDYDIMVKSYKMPSMPSRKSGDVSVPGAYGDYRLKGQKRKSSEIEFTCVMVGNSEGEIQSNIFEFNAKFNDDSEALKVTISDMPGYHAYAYLEEVSDYQVTKGLWNYFAELTITMKMNKPFFYETTPTEFGPFGAFTSKVLTNDGFPQGCKIVLTSTDTAPTITSGTENVVVTINGEVVKYKNGIAVNKPITIDTEACEVWVGEEEDLTDWEGAMPELKNGSNSVSFSAVQANVQLEIVFDACFM